MIRILSTLTVRGWVAVPPDGREIMLARRQHRHGETPRFPDFHTQYNAIKREYPYMLLFFRVGECAPRFSVVDDDAKLIKNLMGERAFTYYLDEKRWVQNFTIGMIRDVEIEEDKEAGWRTRKLIEWGYKVAICE
jgi:DNA mismatch repair ATPase MutS